MKHIGNELYRIIEEKQLVKRTIAMNCGISPSYFSQMLKERSMNAEMLEKICKEIDISPGYFFDDWKSDKYKFSEISYSEIDSGSKDNTIKLMQELLAEKERVIKILSEKCSAGI